MDKQDFLNKGFQRFAERRYERAVLLFRKALELDSHLEPAYSGLSESLNRLGRIDEAIPIVKKWIEINRNDPLAHMALSRLYVQQGMREKAEEEMAISRFLARQAEKKSA